ncbi:MAG: 16S rRNA (cytidine(1402)-2'-O)-methyltransferase [Deltaproteobacteria bacterium]|nr:16S rRNA (cytidine(1402)-2'-O)-methyltransferase [Deltaproteobacteria bacterium]
MPLFIVGTPIGNLRDISQRAAEILKSSDIILAESGERLKILFSHLNIEAKKFMTYREENKKRVTPVIIEYLKENLSVSLISDAGMPAISDPGSFLINEVFENNLSVCLIPGPTAFSSALSASGFSAKEAVFTGFLPRKKIEIEEIITYYRARDTLLVFYESPERILNTLELFDELDPLCKVFIAREMTKKYEEFIRGSPQRLISIMRERTIKGEITAVVKFSELKRKTSYDPELLKILKKENLGTKNIARILADYYKISARSIYNELIKNNH